MWTALFLSMALAQDSKPDQKLDVENTKLLVFDASRGFTLKVLSDGKIEFTVREEDKESGKKSEKSYTAPSAAEFQSRHPELMRKYDLGRHLGGSGGKGLAQEDFDQWWKGLRRGAPPGEEFQKLLEEELGRLRRPFRFPEQPLPETPPRQVPLPAGRELGVKVQDVGETLRDQLSLKENEGVLVTEVKPGSVAEKAGLKEHDLLLRLEGKTITDRWQFRADVLAALGRPELELELLRGGKREVVKVRTTAKKDE